MFNASCGNGEIIVMHSAKYGLMESGTCMRQPVNNRNCDVEVLNIMDGFCSGQQTCIVRPTNPTLIDIKPCPTYAAYLRASYTCLKGNFSLFKYKC